MMPFQIPMRLLQPARDQLVLGRYHLLRSLTWELRQAQVPMMSPVRKRAGWVPLKLEHDTERVPVSELSLREGTSKEYEFAAVEFGKRGFRMW